MPKISNHMILTFNLKASIIKIFQFPFKFKVFCKQFFPMYLHPPHKIVGVPTNLSSKFLFKLWQFYPQKLNPEGQFWGIASIWENFHKRMWIYFGCRRSSRQHNNSRDPSRRSASYQNWIDAYSETLQISLGW